MRMKYDKNNPRLEAFHRRYLELEKGAGGITKVSKLIEMSRPTVQFWHNGERTPDAENIIKLANAFGVSADYLLGITESPSLDADVRSAQEYTGLSDRAVKSLAGDDDLVKAINYLLSREKGIDAIKGVYAFFQKW